MQHSSHGSFPRYHRVVVHYGRDSCSTFEVATIWVCLMEAPSELALFFPHLVPLKGAEDRVPSEKVEHPCGHGSKSRTPVNIPIPTKIGSKMGAPKTPKWDPKTVLTHSYISPPNARPNAFLRPEAATLGTPHGPAVQKAVLDARPSDGRKR